MIKLTELLLERKVTPINYKKVVKLAPEQDQRHTIFNIYKVLKQIGCEFETARLEKSTGNIDIPIIYKNKNGKFEDPNCNITVQSEGTYQVDGSDYVKSNAKLVKLVQKAISEYKDEIGGGYDWAK